MKALFLVFMALAASASDDCREEVNIATEEVVHVVDAKIPKHLEGAVIIVVRKDGVASQVPAEKFMVVPRKQTTVVGENKILSKRVSCDDKDRNLLIGEIKKEVTGLETETSGNEARTYSKKELVPGVNYLRREVLGPIGIGAGVDTNGTVKGLLGVEF